MRKIVTEGGNDMRELGCLSSDLAGGELGFTLCKPQLWVIGARMVAV